VWEPDPETRKIIDIGSMTQCCIDSLKYITLKVAWWDQWNSGTGMKDLRVKGIICDKHNLTGNDYEFFKGTIYTNRFIAPDCPEVSKGIAQVKHLSRTRTNNVTPGSSKHKKDIADTWCGVTQLLLGTLAPNSALRVGRAPASISVGGGGTSAGVSGSNMHAQTNPYGQTGQGPTASRNMAKNHDLFRMLTPLAGGAGRDAGSRLRTSQPRGLPGSTGTGNKFPRGVRL
jgi:hypothetical protein